MTSPIQRMLSRLVELGPRAHVVLDAALDELPVHELAALAYDWPGTWARPKQIIPSGDWRSIGFLTGRGWGKTETVVSFAIAEAAAGRADRIALVGQNEAKTIEILVEGETGILARTPPWIGAQWEPSSNRVVFGNGATAFVYTPQEPSGLRGPQHHLAIVTELAAWPGSTRAEALSNLLLGLRLGYGRLLWDSTPRRRNPLIRELLARTVAHPERHLVVRGATVENAINLSPDVVAEWLEQWGGTQRGREELEGIFDEDDESALFRQAWIDKTRRALPERLVRRILSVDPAITADPRYSDATGIADMGLGVDGQVYLISVAMSGKHRAEVWPGMVVDAYVRGGCDLILLEVNRGGTAHVALLRVAARERGLELVELGAKEKPGTRPGVVYVRTHTVRGTKADRASAAAALLERGRVSFVGAPMSDFEDRLCVFDGEGRYADDDIDAFVAGCHELADLADRAPAGRDAAAQLDGMAERVRGIQRTGALPEQAAFPSMASRTNHARAGRGLGSRRVF